MSQCGHSELRSGRQHNLYKGHSYCYSSELSPLNVFVKSIHLPLGRTWEYYSVPAISCGEIDAVPLLEPGI